MGDKKCLKNSILIVYIRKRMYNVRHWHRRMFCCWYDLYRFFHKYFNSVLTWIFSQVFQLHINIDFFHKSNSWQIILSLTNTDHRTHLLSLFRSWSELTCQHNRKTPTVIYSRVDRYNSLSSDANTGQIKHCVYRMTYRELFQGERKIYFLGRHFCDVSTSIFSKIISQRVSRISCRWMAL